MSTGNGKLCGLCIRATRPEITTSELVSMGATTDNYCDPHKAASNAARRALAEAYRNTKGAFA